MPGVTIDFDETKCAGCEKCAQPEVCFVRAITMEGAYPVRTEICVGCGRCVEACPQQALTLKIKDMQFIDETVRRLTQKVDVTPSDTPFHPQPAAHEPQPSDRHP
jgi:Fe-S-cluster-containing hydrogenase component 2